MSNYPYHIRRAIFNLMCANPDIDARQAELIIINGGYHAADH